MTECPALSFEQLNALEPYLLNRAQFHSGMPLDVAHGYITAVLSGPRDIPVEEWLPPVFGKPDFEDDAEVEQMAELVVALHDQVAHELDHGHYAPIMIHKPEQDTDPLPLPYGWCEGYLFGLTLQGQDIRERMAKDEEAAELLTPIMAFMMYEQEQLLDPPDPARHRQVVAELPDAALKIHRWWLQHRDDRQGDAAETH
jgi:uncharacterized protein